MKKKKKIDLLKKRFKYTNKEYDFTIIEIKESDFIDRFLEIDEGIFFENYEKNNIYIQQFPQKNKNNSEYKGKLSNSWGKIVKMRKHKIIHDCMTYKGSSGSPLILAKNHKVIGLHKGKDKKKIIKLLKLQYL